MCKIKGYCENCSTEIAKIVRGIEKFILRMRKTYETVIKKQHMNLIHMLV